MKKTIMENVKYLVNEAELTFVVGGPKNWAKTDIAFAVMLISGIIAGYGFLVEMFALLGFNGTCIVHGFAYAIAEVNTYLAIIWAASIIASVAYHYVWNMLDMMELKYYNYIKENY